MQKLAYLAFTLLLCLGLTDFAPALDNVVLKRDNREVQVAGRIVVEAQDGGLALLARDGTIWTVQPEELVRRTADDLPFKPFSREEMARHLLKELPEGFDVHSTTRYLIFYNTSRAYASWCGSLFERLYMAFTNYWTRKGFELSTPEFPLVAIVFADKRSYTEFTRAELGEGAESIIGYFSLRTNRMTMHDLTGTEALTRFHNGRSTASQINRILARPEAHGIVATIVHEATHQIAFNCGLHTRLSDCPLWFSEGIAVYFETPDLGSSKGWRSIGALNRPRLARFRQYLTRRPADSLASLIRDDRRLRDPQQSLDAYAEAWALTYFLIRQRPEQYIAYLRTLSEKKPFVWDKPQARLEEFRQAFGDLKTLDAEFLRSLGRIRQ